MNKIERALVERAKKILIEYAREEIETYKKKLNENTGKTMLNVFNTGIYLDIDQLKKDGIRHIETRFKIRKKGQEKDNKEQEKDK